MDDKTDNLQENSELSYEETAYEINKTFRDELEKKYDEIAELRVYKNTLEEKIILLRPPIIEGTRLELKKLNNDLDGKYKVFLKDSTEYIGEFEYRGYHVSDYFGDIGCHILPEHRGNHYMYEALLLLSDHLYNNGIIDFWISAFKENIPSVKTITRLKGILKTDDEKNYILYECNTQEYEKSMSASDKKAI